MDHELISLCRIRYGQYWQSALARDICRIVPGAVFAQVRRTIQRYAAADTAPSPISEAAIRLLVQGAFPTTRIEQG